jgi:hypothetical protein
MSRPATIDIAVWRGASFEQSYELQDEDGAAFDLTGSTIIWRASAVDEAETEVFAYVGGVNEQVLIEDAEAGIITLSLPASITRNIPAGRLTKYELERRIDGSEEVLLAGFIIGEGGANADA